MHADECINPADPPLGATLSAGDVRRLVSMTGAIDALEETLRAGLDPGECPPRTVVDVPTGQLLIMPAATTSYAGLKLATVAPANPERGLPRIQGAYLLCDGASLSPLALIDGIALTALRTPAVSALAVRYLAIADARRLVVFGTGPQAWGHVEALRAVRAIEHVAVIGRDSRRREGFIDRCHAAGLSAHAAEPEDVAAGDIIACCTTSRSPLFPASLVPDHALVIAMGSHEPDTREVDDRLAMRCAPVVVEARSAALREAGDVIQALRSEALDAETGLCELAGVVRGETELHSRRPRLFKSVGMAWEDLAIAALVHERSMEQP